MRPRKPTASFKRESGNLKIHLQTTKQWLNISDLSGWPFNLATILHNPGKCLHLAADLIKHQRLLQRTANYLCPSQFLSRMWSVPYVRWMLEKHQALTAFQHVSLSFLKTRLYTVHHIFTLSLTSGTLPTDWKSATVTPIYKERGNRQVATNYRPISLLSVLSKCLEKLVFKRLYSHLDQFLPIHQSGFRQRDSTADQLARLVHRLATAGDEGNTNLACFYDLLKAFDRVWHKGLLAKLHHFRVRSHALAWITDYLSDRRQCVRLQNSTSSWLPVPAGVPQGSVLGPLLFLAYTIDLPNCVRHPTQCDQFADDTALTTVSSSPGVCEEHLQQSVTATSTWLSNWRLAVNVEKTVTMAFTRRPSLVKFPLTWTATLSPQLMNTDISVWHCLQTCAGQRMSTKFVKSRTLTLHHHTSSAHALTESPYSLLLSLHQTSWWSMPA